MVLLGYLPIPTFCSNCGQTPYRHNKNKEIAKQSYEFIMAQAFSEAHRDTELGLY